MQRHGIASAARLGADDRERPLSLAGRQAVATGAGSLVRAGLTVSTILHSPWLRTEQTAWLMRGLMPTGGRPLPCAALGPALPEGLAGVQAALAATCTAGATLIVSHLPSLAQLVAGWCAPRGPMSGTIEPGQLTCLTFPGPAAPGCGHIIWSRTCQQQADLAPHQLAEEATALHPGPSS